MAIRNFKFPGVELRQEFVDTPVTGESQLGVVVIGNQFKSGSTDWVYNGTASTAAFTDDSYTDIGSADDVSVYITDGFFKEGFEVTSASTGVSIGEGSTVAANGKSATVVFNTNITASTVFGSLPPAVGDSIDITGSGTASTACVITAITGGTALTAEVSGESASIAGTTVTKAQFYKVVPDAVEITGASVSGNSIELPATVTATIGGQATASTLQTSTAPYKISIKYNKPTAFKLGSVGSLADIRKEFGEVNLNNEMAVALYVALQAAQTNIVYYVGLLEDSATGFRDAIDFLDRYDNIYSIVPLTYDEAAIKQCITAAEASATNVESKIRRTVWYGLETPAENKVAGLIAKRQAIGASYRAQAVWADDILFNAEVLPNYIVAAAPAGMRSYEPVHRPISNLGYTFFSVLNPSGMKMSDLAALGKEGIWILDNNYNYVVVNKKQVTTAVANNLNLDEESIVSNADSIALTLCHVGENLVGCSNISPMLLKSLRDTITNIMNNYTINLTGNPYVGPQLLSWSLDALFQHPTALDHIYAVITCTPPKPFNRFVMTLRIV